MNEKFINHFIESNKNTYDIFKKEPLYILKILKAISVLDYEIDNEVETAMFNCKEYISNIDYEYIRIEFSELIIGSNAVEVLSKYREIFAIFIPEIKPMFNFLQNNPYHKYDVWNHTLKVIENISNSCSNFLILRLSALFHDIGKPPSYTEDENGTGHFYRHSLISCDIAENVMHRLHYDNETIKQVCLLVKNHDRYISCKKKSVVKFLNKYDIDFFNDYLLLRKADIMAQADCMYDRLEDLHTLKYIAYDVISEKKSNKSIPLNVNGEDLKNIGIPQGKIIGDILIFLTTEVLEGRLENNKEHLIEKAKTLNNFK